MGIDPATGRGTCESIPKSPLPTECSSKFQDVGVCTEDGSCVPTPCDPANNAAECPPPLFYYSNCATPICTESGTCDFAIADAGTVCTPGFPEGNTVEDGVCNGRVCYGPGQCRTDFRGQCNAPTELYALPSATFSRTPHALKWMGALAGKLDPVVSGSCSIRLQALCTFMDKQPWILRICNSGLVHASNSADKCLLQCVCAGVSGRSCQRELTRTWSRTLACARHFKT